MNMDYLPQINKAYLLIAISLDFAPVEVLLEGTTISLDDIQTKSSFDIAQAIPLVHNLLKYSDNPNLAVIFGQHLGVTAHGPVGYATISAPTLGKALETFLEWFQLRCQTYSGKIAEGEEHIEIQVLDTTRDTIFQSFFFEALMRAFEILIGLVLGHAPKNDTSLHFKIDATGRRDEMNNAYDSKLFFNADVNKICISKKIWFEPSPMADRESYELNLKKCQQLLEQQQGSKRIDLQVKHILNQHFDQAKQSLGMDKPFPNLAMISTQLNLTERTLIRRLKSCNTSYKQIVELLRLRNAEQLLLDARYTIYHVADILGYRESANFCRAFKRWTGQSPAQFRRLPQRNKDKLK